MIKKNCKIICVLIIILFLNGCYSDDGFLIKDNKERTIICFGDSLTEGYRLPKEDSYPSLLQVKLEEEGYDNYTVINEGISGDTTLDALKRVDKILTQNPDLIILAVGANDGLQREDPLSIESNLRMLVKRILDKNIKLLLVGMEMPINLGLTYRSEFNDIYPKISDEFDLVLVPFMLKDVANYRNLNLDDNIHPNAQGYKIVLDNIWEYLQ